MSPSFVTLPLYYPCTSPCTIPVLPPVLSLYFPLYYPCTSPCTIPVLPPVLSLYFPLYYPCTSPCTIPVLPPVLSLYFPLYFPCTTPALPQYYPCTTSVLPPILPLHCLSTTPVLRLYYPCTTPVPSLYYPCTAVLHLSLNHPCTIPACTTPVPSLYYATPVPSLHYRRTILVLSLNHPCTVPTTLAVWPLVPPFVLHPAVLPDAKASRLTRLLPTSPAMKASFVRQGPDKPGRAGALPGPVVREAEVIVKGRKTFIVAETNGRLKERVSAGSLLCRLRGGLHRRLLGRPAAARRPQRGSVCLWLYGHFTATWRRRAALGQPGRVNTHIHLLSKQRLWGNDLVTKPEISSLNFRRHSNGPCRCLFERLSIASSRGMWPGQRTGNTVLPYTGVFTVTSDFLPPHSRGEEARPPQTNPGGATEK
ncbi:hypothetical protein Bbelb_167010 [Branchiostoma belcheri]|nr:hypothetical protein Bbelb_167010 [Branchiostoma belcheri]